MLAESCGVDAQMLQLRLMSDPTSATTPTAGSAVLAVNTAKPGASATLAAASPQDVLQCDQLPASDALQDLLDGKIRCVEYSGGQVFADAPRSVDKVYLPGSFNPLHAGHQALLKAAVQAAAASSGAADVQGCFELTAVNADKVSCTA